MQNKELKDGDFCKVIGGTHKGKSGTATNLNISKTGHLTITVVRKMATDSKPWQKMWKLFQTSRNKIFQHATSIFQPK